VSVNRLCTAVLSAAAIGIGGCNSVRKDFRIPSPEDNDVVCAAVRYLNTKSTSVAVHGLLVGSGDPSPQLRDKLRSMSSIVPASQVHFVNLRGYDVKTGRRADVFSVDPATIKWVRPEMVTIEGGGGSLGITGTFTIVRRGRSWTVQSYHDSGLMR